MDASSILVSRSMIDTKDVKKLKEDIVFETEVHGNHLIFHSTWGLFSPREIDEGSRLFLEHVDLPQQAKILDIGCGYGALGISIAKEAPERMLHMVDTDFVAVEFAKKNAEVNGVAKNCEVYLSNGFSNVPKNLKFDAVISNLPAKVGRELLWILLNDAKDHLVPGGALYVVTISGLREFIKKNFIEVFGNYDKVKQGRAHTVAKGIKGQSVASSRQSG
jgi:16S rRNA (guanine1207-N2)-methyltransferase